MYKGLYCTVPTLLWNRNEKHQHCGNVAMFVLLVSSVSYRYNCTLCMHACVCVPTSLYQCHIRAGSRQPFMWRKDIQLRYWWWPANSTANVFASRIFSYCPSRSHETHYTCYNVQYKQCVCSSDANSVLFG